MTVLKWNAKEEPEKKIHLSNLALINIKQLFFKEQFSKNALIRRQQHFMPHSASIVVWVRILHDGMHVSFQAMFFWLLSGKANTILAENLSGEKAFCYSSHAIAWKQESRVPALTNELISIIFTWPSQITNFTITSSLSFHQKLQKPKQYKAERIYILMLWMKIHFDMQVVGKGHWPSQKICSMSHS